MDDRREELCIEKCLMGRLVKSRMKLAGYDVAEWMKTTQGCPSKEGKEERKTALEIRWQDCVEREIRRTALEIED